MTVTFVITLVIWQSTKLHPLVRIHTYFTWDHGREEREWKWQKRVNRSIWWSRLKLLSRSTSSLIYSKKRRGGGIHSMCALHCYLSYHSRARSTFVRQVSPKLILWLNYMTASKLYWAICNHVSALVTAPLHGRITLNSREEMGYSMKAVIFICTHTHSHCSSEIQAHPKSLHRLAVIPSYHHSIFCQVHIILHV